MTIEATEKFLRFFKVHYLCLSDGLLNVIVGELVGDSVSNSDTVAFEKKIVVHDGLNVAVETPCHLVVKLHGNDVHEGPGLVTECVLGENTTEQFSVFDDHLDIRDKQTDTREFKVHPTK